MDKKIFLPEVINWKLREVINRIKVISKDSITYKANIISELNLPIHSKFTESTITITDIDWSRMPIHYKFFLDESGSEDIIKEAFKRSDLKNSKNIIILYGLNEPAVLIPLDLFIEDWENFIASTHWETIIFSEDFRLIMEVSRNYYLHSNFKILNK